MRNRIKIIVTFIVLLLPFTAYAEDSFSGVGLEIMTMDNQTIIKSVIPNSPADKEGITPGLVILKVDNKSTSGMEVQEVAFMIRGPVGDKVRLELFDPEKNNTTTLEIIRAIIE